MRLGTQGAKTGNAESHGSMSFEEEKQCVIYCLIRAAEGCGLLIYR
jgi:hypothetical protein